MIDRSICSKCCTEYVRRYGAPGAVGSQGRADPENRWLCTIHLAAKQWDAPLINESSEIPKDCLCLFEQCVASGMTQENKP